MEMLGFKTSRCENAYSPVSCLLLGPSALQHLQITVNCHANASTCSSAQLPGAATTEQAGGGRGGG